MELTRWLTRSKWERAEDDKQQAKIEALDLAAAAVPAGPVVDHVVGLDLGQARDFSALAVVEKSDPPNGEPIYAVRHLRRWPLGTPYPAIVAEVTALVKTPPLSRPRLAIDQTGVGRAVVEMFTGEMAATVCPILITGGHAVTHDGSWHVPKKELVSVLQVLIGADRIGVAPDLPLARVLVAELKSFKAKITVAGNETFEAWRERDHDDLVLAVAMACWLAERTCRGKYELL